MVSIYQLKSAFQTLLSPIVQRFASQGITANQVTLAASGLSIAVGLVLAWCPTSRWVYGAIPVVLFIRMGLNAIDGMLARNYNMKTALGAMLNELGDVMSDAAIYLPFARIPMVSAPLIVLIVILGIISEMAGVLGQTRRYDGPMGKSDRAVVFGLVSGVLAIGITPGSWLTVIWGIVLILLVWTIFNRVQNTTILLSTSLGNHLDVTKLFQK
jgi:CDP-diacylglycerol--glycerol-3-phosphate 3-phosphatidyltransferase